MMLTITEIADRDGVSKPTVSIRVKKFADRHSLRVERDAQGRIVGVDAAEYDRLRLAFDSPARAQQEPEKRRPQRIERPQVAVSTRSASVSSSDPAQLPLFEDTYDAALMRKTQFDAELKRLAIEETKRRLVDVELMAQSLDRTAQVVIDALNRLEDAADEVAAAVGKNGVRGAHAAMRKLKTEVLKDIADRLGGEAKAARAMIDDGGSDRMQ